MKVCILHLHDSAGLYGAETVILTLCKALKTSPFNPIVGCLMASDKEKPALGLAAEQLNLDVRYFPMRLKIDVLVVPKIVKEIKNNNIKLIHAHGYKSNLIGLLAACASRVPVITTNHLFPPMPLHDKKLQFYSKIDVTFTMKRLHKIIAVSEEIKEKLIASGISSLKIEVIDNGIDIEEYVNPHGVDLSALRASLGIKNGSYIVGTFGRLTTQKGHAFLLEAAKKILSENLPVMFLIAGDGYLRESLENLSHQLNIAPRVKFLGFRKDTSSLLKIMDVFVLSSIDEGLPIAMIEAMAAKTPVVVTDVGDIPKIIKDYENGILVEPRNSDMLAEKISFLLQNKEIRNTLAESAFGTVSRYHSKEAMCSRYLEVYNKVIEPTEES